MMMFRALNTFLILVVLMMSTTKTYALDERQEKVMMVQHDLELRMGAMIKSFDPAAFIYVKIVPDITETQLPMTAFMFEDLKMSADGKLKLKSLEIHIFSKMEKLPEGVEAYINLLSSEYSIKPTLKLEKIALPADLERLEKERKEEEQKKADAKKPFFQKHETEMIYSGIAGVFMILVILGFVLRRSEGKQMQSAVQTSLQGLSKALESSGMGGAQAVQAQAKDKDKGMQLEVNTSAKSIWESFTLESLAALLSDCYWCELDQYAAFIWKKIPLDKKVELIQKVNFLADYTKLITTIEEDDLGFEQDPYYMNPLNINHVNNALMVGEVQKRAWLITRLSKIRATNLPLKAKERLDLFMKSREMAVVTDGDLDFSKLTASALRIIKVMEKIQINNLEEEKEILESNIRDFDLMSHINTLGWVKDLSETEVAEMLNAVSAKDLARAWVSTPDVLEYMQKQIPEKKWQLVQNYLESAAPDRNSAEFNTLYTLVIEKLRAKRQTDSKQENATNNVNTDKKAA
jgi:hypothetical protein